jgi:alpha-beta hydrolase superfamily lysophospholipase
MEPVHHSPIDIPNPGGRTKWTLFLSAIEPARLVVFVHGFGGKAIRTWHEFDLSGQTRPWWRESDMLFVGYESRKERPSETAAWLRHRLADFYPILPSEVTRHGEVRARPDGAGPYRELILVGHSLGGFVLRLALLQEARTWLFEDREKDPDAPRPPILDGALRLFSPASAGFKPAGLLAIITCLFTTSVVVLKGSPAFAALQPESDLLVNTRTKTEALVELHRKDLSALRAHIMWARPEQVVEREGYQTDYEAESLIPIRNHSDVCKPHLEYEQPWNFVETGKHGA